MNYEQKYLKYKKKYIDLKNQLGASEITARAAAADEEAAAAAAAAAVAKAVAEKEVA